MAPSKLRKAIEAVKDKTSIGLAKVNSSSSIPDIDVAIVKATRHEEYPADERHIRDILSLTSYSQAYVSSCVASISKRLSKTKNWVVALKTLMLIHRLIVDGDRAYEQDIFFSTRRGTRLLNMSDFRDTSRSNSWDYSAFVRTYALYLDECLEFRMQGRRGKHSAFAYEEQDQAGSNDSRATPVREMKIDQVLSRIQHLMHLLDRFMACRPTGAAKTNRMVIVALYPLANESFQLYYDITEILGILVDRFMELDVPDSIKVHEIFCRVSKQYDELEMFYGWCKTIGIARSSEYPDVEKITQKKLEVMDEFIREKSAMARNRHMKMAEQRSKPQNREPEDPEPKPESEQSMNQIKALPPPEELPEEPCKEKKLEEHKEKQNNTPEVVDFLNLGANATTTTQEQGDQLALALFDVSLATAAPATSSNSAWEAFSDSGDWEASLLHSASHLSNQQPKLPGGINQLMLDSMYQQRPTQQMVASSSLMATGSASSVASCPSGRPEILALPAPPVAQRPDVSAPMVDPFAASLSVAAPPYVQMTDLEKKQRLLVQEQVMWQQYAREGRQGEVGLTRVQQNYPHHTGGYTYMRTH